MVMEKKIKIVSACLAGLKCRYDGASKERADIIKMVANGEAIPVCPEQLGGLPTPRTPAEIVDDKVLSVKGEDVTLNYDLGANEALKIASMVNCEEALLKSKSPMCGCNEIYDGSYSGKTISGDGIFTRLLKKAGIKVSPID